MLLRGIVSRQTRTIQLFFRLFFATATGVFRNKWDLSPLAGEDSGFPLRLSHAAYRLWLRNSGAVFSGHCYSLWGLSSLRPHQLGATQPLAPPTEFEPVTSGVTGRHTNQNCAAEQKMCPEEWDSNP